MVIDKILAEHSSASPHSGDDVTRLLSYRISVLSRLLAREGAAIYAKRIGLSLPEWRVISTLGHFGEASVTDIAAHTFMDRGQTSRTVDTLMNSGMLRMRPDVGNGRRLLFSLSPDGEALHQAGLPVARQRQQALVEGVAADDLEAFERVLDQMMARYAGDGGGDPA